MLKRKSKLTILALLALAFTAGSLRAENEMAEEKAAPPDQTARPEAAAPEKRTPDEIYTDLQTAFEGGNYEFVIEAGPKARKGAGMKLTPEQRAQIALWEGESLLRTGKFPEADKTLREAMVGNSSDAAQRASEIVKILKPALPSGNVEGGLLSDPTVLASAMTTAGETVAKDAQNVLEQIVSSMESTKTMTSLAKTNDPKKAKAPWHKLREKFSAGLQRLKVLQPEKCTELATELATKECAHYSTVINKLRRELGRTNPFKVRMTYWMGSDRVTSTKWKEFQNKTKECAPAIIALRGAAHLLGEAKAFPESYGGKSAESALNPVETSVFADNAGQLLSDIMASDRPKSDQVDEWEASWESLGRVGADESNN